MSHGEGRPDAGPLPVSRWPLAEAAWRNLRIRSVGPEKGELPAGFTSCFRSVLPLSTGIRQKEGGLSTDQPLKQFPNKQASLFVFRKYLPGS